MNLHHQQRADCAVRRDQVAAHGNNCISNWLMRHQSTQYPTFLPAGIMWTQALIAARHPMTPHPSDSMQDTYTAGRSAPAGTGLHIRVQTNAWHLPAYSTFSLPQTWGCSCLSRKFVDVAGQTDRHTQTSRGRQTDRHNVIRSASSKWSWAGV